MTTVYGVTFVGAREQIEKQLKERGDIPLEECYLTAAYLARQVLQCIGDLFQGANDIMTWLTYSARIISKSIPSDRIVEAMELDKTPRARTDKAATTRLRKEQMSTVVWTTPLGLPVVQPYRKIKRKQIHANLQSVYISDPNAPAEVNSQKQASAFPPNFIHSLDATHMLLTALECRTQGLTFASVHDSYWTHASSIDHMSAIIRQTFVALHSSDVLGRLENEFRERYANHKVPLVSLRSAQMVKQLDLFEGATDTEALDTAKNDDNSKSEAAVVEMAEKDGEPTTEKTLEHPPTVTVLSKEQALYLLKPGRGKVKKPRRTPSQEKEDGLHGKFVNLVDLLRPVPAKGEFDVNKIKSSLYFFS